MHPVPETPVMSATTTQIHPNGDQSNVHPSVQTTHTTTPTLPTKPTVPHTEPSIATARSSTKAKTTKVGHKTTTTTKTTKHTSKPTRRRKTTSTTTATTTTTTTEPTTDGQHLHTTPVILSDPGVEALEAPCKFLFYRLLLGVRGEALKQTAPSLGYAGGNRTAVIFCSFSLQSCTKFLRASSSARIRLAT